MSGLANSEDWARASKASDAIAREEQVRTAELACWDVGVAHIRDGLGPWQPDRDTYQWAVQQNRLAAEQHVDGAERWGGQQYEQPQRDTGGRER